MISYSIYYILVFYAEVPLYHLGSHRTVGKVCVVDISAVKSQMSHMIIEDIGADTSENVMEQSGLFSFLFVTSVFIGQLQGCVPYSVCVVSSFFRQIFIYNSRIPQIPLQVNMARILQLDTLTPQKLRLLIPTGN